MITVKSIDGNKMASCSVEVTEFISSIVLDKSQLTLLEGLKMRLNATVTPDGFGSQIHWSSSDELIAEVSSDGEVTAVSAGTAIITVQLERGKRKATCEVLVKSISFYGVIIDVCQTSGGYGYEVCMLRDGTAVCYDSVDLKAEDTKKLYTALIDENEAVVRVEPVEPNLLIAQGEIISITNNVVKYGSPEKNITLSSDLIVYKMDADNRYEVGTISDIIGRNASFYDFDDDRVFDIVLLPD